MALRTETEWGEPVEAGGAVVVAAARRTRLSLPFLRGGLVWARPSLVRVRLPGGSERALPIPDRTRYLELLFLGFGLLGAFLFWRAGR